jgi:hypothetical protein
MAEIQIQPKSAKRTKGLGRPDTVGDPSSVRIMRSSSASLIAHMDGDRGNAAELGHLKGEAAIW